MEESTTPLPLLRNHAFKFGVIMGIIAFIITIVMYIIDYALLASVKVLLLILVFYIGFVIYSGIAYRKEIGGYLDYGKAFQYCFIMMAVAGLIGVIGNILLYTVIDPELPAKVTKVSVENTISMMQSLGVSSDRLDSQLAKIESDSMKRFTPVGFLISYGWALVINAIFATILALFVRKTKPVM